MAKTLLTPPPLAPPCGWSFQTTSSWIAPFAAISSVPPQPSTCGLEAGKSTLLPLPPSLEPLSPEATVIVMPSATADWQASSKAVIDCAVQFDSSLPQLMEITDGGPLVVS